MSLGVMLLRAKERMFGVLLRRTAKSLHVRARLTRDVSVKWKKIMVRISVGMSCRRVCLRQSVVDFENCTGADWMQFIGKTMADIDLQVDIVSLVCHPRRYASFRYGVLRVCIGVFRAWLRCGLLLAAIMLQPPAWQRVLARG